MTVNPAMITLGRELRGWTQRQLADALGVSHGKIAKYELGALAVSDADHARMATRMEFDRSFFEQGDLVYGLGSSFIFHRQRARIPIKVQSRCQAAVNVRLMQLVRLLRAAGVRHEHDFPQIPTARFRGSPERVAKEVRRLWAIPEGPIANLTAVVENAGGIVIKMPFDTSLIDGVHLWAPGAPPVFFMNEEVPGDRARFSLAHEIAHAVMHNGFGSALDDIEDEADRFASEFLMPRDDIRSDLARMSLETAARLKPVWKVSMQAIIRRARDLGQITESTYRRLFTALSASCGRITEPFPIPVEESTVWQDLIAVHKTKLGFDDEEMMSLLFTANLNAKMPPTDSPELRLSGELLFNPSSTEPPPPSLQ